MVIPNFLKAWLPDHQSDLAALYLTETLRNFGLSLVGIFVPIYIFQLTGNFYYLPAYYFIFAAVAILTLLPYALLLPRIGVGASVFLSNLLRVGILGLLLAAPLAHPLILLAAALEGLLIPTYWVVYHLIYAEEGKLGFYGREIGLMGLLAQVAGAAAPFLGGLVITFWGFPALYTFGITLVLLSSLPLGVVKDRILRFDSFSPREVLSGLKEGAFRPLLVGYGGHGTEALVASIFWPLFLFGVAGSFAALGAIASLPLLVGILATLVVPPLVDKLGYRRSLFLGVPLWAFFWLLAGWLNRIWMILILLIFRALTGHFGGIPPDAITYTLAKPNPLPLILKRELALHGAGLLAAPLLALLWFFFPENWPVLFLPAVLGALLTISLAFAKLR